MLKKDSQAQMNFTGLDITVAKNVPCTGKHGSSRIAYILLPLIEMAPKGSGGVLACCRERIPVKLNALHSLWLGHCRMGDLAGHYKQKERSKLIHEHCLHTGAIG